MIPVRLYAYAAGLLALVGLLWYAHHQVYQDGYKAAQAEYAKELETQREHNREIDEETERGHQEKVSALQGRIDKLLARRNDAIRVCEPANEVRTGSDPGGATGSTGDGPVMRSGPDLQPRLVLYGGRCEKLRQQLIDIKNRQTARDK
jgi:predicted phage gp36 major capsid-like protein